MRKKTNPNFIDIGRIPRIRVLCVMCIGLCIERYFCRWMTIDAIFQVEKETEDMHKLYILLCDKKTIFFILRTSRTQTHTYECYRFSVLFLHPSQIFTRLIFFIILQLWLVGGDIFFRNAKEMKKNATLRKDKLTNDSQKKND